MFMYQGNFAEYDIFQMWLDLPFETLSHLLHLHKHIKVISDLFGKVIRV